MYPGSRPLQSTIIAASLMRGFPKYSETAALTASGLAGDGAPTVTLPPVVTPSPVAYSVRGSSRFPGWSLFTRVPSAWYSAAPCSSMNTAGAYLDTVTVKEDDAAIDESERTTRGYRPAASVGGSWA